MRGGGVKPNIVQNMSNPPNFVMEGLTTPWTSLTVLIENNYFPISLQKIYLQIFATYFINQNQ